MSKPLQNCGFTAEKRLDLVENADITMENVATFLFFPLNRCTTAVGATTCPVPSSEAELFLLDEMSD